MIQYLILVIAFQLLFLLIYDVLLKKATFFNQNRAYLLGTHVLSLVLPLIKIERFQQTVPATFVLPDFTITQSSNVILLDGVTVTATQTLSWWEIIPIAYVVFGFGVLVGLVWFVAKLWQIQKVKKQSKKVSHQGYTEYVVPNSAVAFSFFNNVFLGQAVKENEHSHILAHELVHVQHKHSIDLLLFELLRILFWFNPMVYMYQKRITELHEYIADSYSGTSKKDQYQLLLQEVFQTKNISFINQFFNHSLIKKRIVMLQKSKSKKVELVKYALLIPMVIGMLVYTASCTSETVSEEDVSGKEMSVYNEFSEALLKEKYLKEIQERVANGENIHEIFQEHNKSTDKNRKATKEEFCYGCMILYVISEDFKDNSLREDTQKRMLESTYADYLKRQDSISKSTKSIATTYHQEEPTIPYEKVYKKPMFKSCVDATDTDACFKEKLNEHVMNNFTYPKEAQDAKIQGRVYVHFQISSSGAVTVLQTRAPSELLGDEAKRILELLPDFIPGKDKNGKAVPVTFAYPIVFRLNPQPTK